MDTYRSAFISHAHADNARCASIAALLRAKGIDVWIDLTNAQQGRDLGAAINDELERRTAFVLMVTATSNTSYWVQLERGAYIALLSSKAKRILNGVERLMLPVRLSGDVPVILGGLLWIDAVGKSDVQVAREIAEALAISRDPSYAPAIQQPSPVYNPPMTTPRVPATAPASYQVPDITTYPSQGYSGYIPSKAQSYVEPQSRLSLRRLSCYGLIGLGVLMLLVGLVNHYVIKPSLNFVPHTSTVILAVGVVLAIIGAALLFLGGGNANTAN